MGASPSVPRSWKGKLRRLVAAPFRLLFKEELSRLDGVERGLAELALGLRELREASSRISSDLFSQAHELGQGLRELREAFLQTRGDFEEVRDKRVPTLEADFSRFQASFGQLQGELENVRDERLPQLERSQGGLQVGFAELQGEILALRDERVSQLERGEELLQMAHSRLQVELEHLRDERFSRLGQEVAALQQNLAEVQALAEEVRDQRLPAAVDRINAILERITEELHVVRSLTDRLLYREPLAVPPLDVVGEQVLPAAVREASLRFMAAHRGSREEILTRAREYVDIFRDAAPVLDLGCGRGELLQALREAGIEAFGVDADPAAVAVCGELGLAVELRDALEALHQQDEASLGGVVMVHLVEHLPHASWMQLFAETRRVLRPGGILAVESPNPETLRVGGSAFWVDPTHVHPVHPEAARFVAEAVGFEVVEVRRLHFFPQEQKLAEKVADAALKDVFRLLDDWLSGPRDFLLVARKPLSA